MSAITATDARKNFFGILQQVNDDRTAVEVVSKRGNAVIISKADYDALIESMHLLSTPANDAALALAREQIESGQTVRRGLNRS
ncbi:MAG TPA: type II toxin-antitoxin system Phd/YefM family antitoxin [Terrimesophilobacter sp.]|nr:type II toxin-antitoxin system Phd/YefM family antitoxin [Terrimesophilobacter sp.]HRQ00657.1 type II toxin-antitoxin system Phd/YefM family antitoxin [Terrimesophilobacter sp.]